MARNNRTPALPEAESSLDRFKYEVADELGLLEKIKREGWENMTTREVGKVGGHMVRKMIRMAEESLIDDATQPEKHQLDEFGTQAKTPGTST